MTKSVEQLTSNKLTKRNRSVALERMETTVHKLTNFLATLPGNTIESQTSEFKESAPND